MDRDYEVIVIGGGHAGVEAAWAAANLLPGRATVALVTMDPAKIGVMSCNPAVGGLAKGQLVREIDALGGLMGLAADATGIMFKVLNTSRGPAVRGPRTQNDKHAYAEAVQSLIASREEIDVIAGAVDRFLIEHGRVRGIEVERRAHLESEGASALRARAVVLTTGTFMRGLMHAGARKTPGGRHGEGAALGISATLRDLGFELGRLKTGTPPRLQRDSIDWQSLDVQRGDDDPAPFSDLTRHGWRAGGLRLSAFPRLEQVECRATSTTPDIHDLIRDNLHLAPIFSGEIESMGPRYCPSIEDKVVRFAGRESHTVFLEPESHRSDWVYCNGISTSLPLEIQERIVRAMPGCERARILQPGYAVEYDMVRPHQIHATGMTRLVEGLFLAGQINGTSGYEEAAAQGLVAGVNAARRARSEGEWTLRRDQAYIGVLMDDLVTKTPREPYRMFTSRAEHRLLLRPDNAADRLTQVADELGLLGSTPLGQRRRALFKRRRDQLQRVQRAIDATRHEGEPLALWCRRPGFGPDDLATSLAHDDSLRDVPAEVWLTAHADRWYEAYIRRDRAEIKRRAELERRRIPPDVDYNAMTTLRTEARLALERFKPATFGQAGRLEGVTPADLTLLSVLLGRRRPERPTALAKSL